MKSTRFPLLVAGAALLPFCISGQVGSPPAQSPPLATAWETYRKDGDLTPLKNYYTSLHSSEHITDLWREFKNITDADKKREISELILFLSGFGYAMNSEVRDGISDLDSSLGRDTRLALLPSALHGASDVYENWSGLRKEYGVPETVSVDDIRDRYALNFTILYCWGNLRRAFPRELLAAWELDFSSMGKPAEESRGKIVLPKPRISNLPNASEVPDRE